MKMSFSRISIWAFAIICFFSAGCANIAAPTGGPRDSIPPVLIQAVPGDSTLNFKSDRIVFTFNEYIDIQNVHENLIVSPTLKNMPIVDHRLRTITVRIKDTLDPNTTYTFDFGNAIRDINEGNVFKNFLYLLSTGDYIDTFSLTGKVVLAETGKVDSTLIVMLHRNMDDSAVVNERPRYYTRLNGEGYFSFRYLAPGTYRLFALKDESSLRRYMSPTQLFAFATDSIVVNGNQQPVMLYAYAEEEDEKAGRTRQQLSISNFIQKADDKRLRYQTNLQGNMQDLLSDLILSFGRPLTNFDSTKLQLTIGEFKPVYYQFEADSLNKNFTFKTRWIPDSTYNLIIGQDVGEDSLGNKLTKTDTLSFRTEMESAYGSLRIKFTNFNPSAKQVLQLVSNNVVAYSIPITSGEYFAPLFKPGDYEIRILNDSNGNGIWDPGKFFGEYRQPEIVVSFEKKLTVRANWENETSIEL